MGALSLTQPEIPVPSSQPQTRRGWLPRGWFPRRAVQPPATPPVEPIFDRLAVLGSEIAAEGQRVLDGSRSIACQSKQHSDELEESLRVIDEIRGVVQSSVALCRHSDGQVASARQLVAQTHALCAERSLIIEGLLDSVERSHTAFSGLDDNLRDVERFLGVIQEIGNQTNLLALNASIEAARAGVHGQGFLVVAREMRLLADRTNDATEQIRQITERIQSSTGTAAETLGASLKASAASREQGTRVVSTIVAAQEPMREAEGNAQRMAADAGRQLEALTRLEDHWRSMRKGALNCTYEADASAERSMHTIRLATRFFADLAGLGACFAGTNSGDWTTRTAALDREAERCIAAAGLARLHELRPRLEAAMRDFQLESKRRGLPSRRGRLADGDILPELLFGGRPVNESTEQVDLVLRRTGLTATLFVLASQPDGSQAFYRVATSLKRADGVRAVGTALNPRGSVAAQLLAGEPAFGFVYILGTPYLAAYEPILDAVGDVIGAWYVGMSLGDRG